jgi:ankyrin repeat protein
MFKANILLFSECVHLLLAHGAPVKVKNLAGWSPLAEAISYGDRQTSKHVWMMCTEWFVLIGFVTL